MLLGACGEESRQETAPTEGRPVQEEADPGAIDLDALEELRALGYVDVGEALPEGAAVGVLIHDRERSAAGLNLFTSAHNCRTELMDMEGNVLHSWSHKPCFRWGNAVLTPAGDLLVVGRETVGTTPESESAARYLLRVAWDGTVKWKRTIPVHHDVELTPDGRIASLIYGHRLIPEVDEATPVRDNSVVLFTADGELLEEVSLWDILGASDEFTIQPVSAQPRRFERAPEIDYLHTNAIEWMRHPELVGSAPIYRENSVLLCVRHQDAVVLIDWDTKKILWSWGQGRISGPHDATMLASGNILVFDNGLGRDWSRIVEVDPRTDEVVWEYRAPDITSFYSKTRGSNQRLSNGNTLIADSDSGRALEVTPAGETVWEFLNPNMSPKREPSLVVRMRRYEGLDFESLRELAEKGQLPLVD